MRSLELALLGSGKVLFAGLVFGAGLPVVYALAMRALTVGGTTTVDADGRSHARRSPLGLALAALLVAVVVGGVVLGLVLIVAGGLGKAVSFEHVVPVLVEEK